MRSAHLNKNDAALQNADAIVFVAYAAQHDPRKLIGAPGQRKKDSEMGKKLTVYCTLKSEMGAIEFPRLQMLETENYC